VENICNTDLSGSTCVLTRTNEEAVQVAGMLTHRGYKARLIQSSDTLKLSNLEELRDFTDYINNKNESPVIPEEDWEAAKQHMYHRYSKSNKLDWFKIIIRDFEDVNPKRKYKGDWKNFLQESRFEDFVQITGDTICISTLHKSKGREFDNVFLMLNNADIHNDDRKRELYVAITRAKHNLYVHYNGNFMQQIHADSLTYMNDHRLYQAPEHLTILANYEDVHLSYFEYVQHRMKDIQSGTTLFIAEDGLTNAAGDLVLKFSKAFLEKTEEMKTKGYRIEKARTNFVVFWKNPQTGKETKLLLPEITFSYRPDNSN
jgi:ATP-dependent DNA helicase RecQ